MSKKKDLEIMAVFGPTGSGKTSQAISLFEQDPNSLLISIDSRKVYKELDIGTNKLKLKKYIKEQGVADRVFGLDLYWPDEKFSVSEYRGKVYNWLYKIIKRGKRTVKRIIFFGGSGLYLDTVLFNLPLQELGPDLKMRKELNKLPVDELQKKLKELDHVLFNSLSQDEMNNRHRLIRKIEVSSLKIGKVDEGEKKISKEERFILNLFSEATLSLSLSEGDKSNLLEKINERVLKMLEQGWVEEVFQLLQKYKLSCPGLNVMGYIEIASFLMDNFSNAVKKGDVSTVEWLFLKNRQNTRLLIEKIQLTHQQYAKRQLTWAKRYKKGLEKIYPERRVDFREFRV